MAVPSELTVLASNLTHLFLTNAPPSESEKIDIHHILTLANRDLTVLKEDDRLIREDLATKCRAAISCIRRIPPELISNIFAMCVPDHVDDNQPWCTLHSACVPWVLARVSNLWRAIAISQPALWAFMKIDLRWVVRSGISEPPLAVLETALERSGNMPLRVVFHDGYKPTDRAQEILSSLMAHSHRWSQLSIYISYAHLHLTNRVRGRLPLLRYLDIGAYRADTFPPFDGFSIAPMLYDVFLRDEWEVLILPWAQLTSLGGAITGSPAPAIRQSPELLRCHFYFTGGITNEFFPSIPVEHKKLTHITMDDVEPLKYMRFPSLQEIIILNLMPFTDDPPIFADFFQHSGGSLRVFIWKRAVIIDPIEFRTILQSIPNLVELEIGISLRSQPSIQTEITIPLTISQSWCALPKLRSVRIPCNIFNASSQPIIDPFLDMVESRWFENDRKDVMRLREAKFTKLSSWDLSSSPIKERIDTLLEQGFLLTFDEPE